MVISEDKQEQVVVVDICCLFLQLPTMFQRWGRNNYLDLAYLAKELLMLTCRSDQNSTECKYRERAIILIAFSTGGALEWKGGKKEITEGGRAGRKEGGRKEGKKAVHKLWACSLSEISDKSCFLKEWQTKCFICNFKIEFIPF